MDPDQVKLVSWNGKSESIKTVERLNIDKRRTADS